LLIGCNAWNWVELAIVTGQRASNVVQVYANGALRRAATPFVDVQQDVEQGSGIRSGDEG
jgi:hypothetical protein